MRLPAVLVALALLLAAVGAVADRGGDGNGKGKGRDKDGDRSGGDGDGDDRGDDGERGDDGGDRDDERDGDGGNDEKGDDGEDDKKDAKGPERKEQPRRVSRAVPAPPPAANGASVELLLTPSPGHLLVTALAARPAGELAAVTLDVELPDVGSPWALGGPAADSGECALDGTRIACSLGLAGGEVALVQAEAHVASAPGWAPEASARVAAAGDSRAAEDAATAQAGLLLMGPPLPASSP